MARASDVDSNPVQLPASIAHIRRNLYSLNLGYLTLMKNLGETDMNLAIHIFNRIPENVLQKIAAAPYQVLAEIARVLTITPVLRSDMPDSAWLMLSGVIEGEVDVEDFGAYVISMSGK